jgi:hypothetical protein
MWAIFLRAPSMGALLWATVPPPCNRRHRVSAAASGADEALESIGAQVQCRTMAPASFIITGPQESHF